MEPWFPLFHLIWSRSIGVFNSENLINHWSVIWTQFKDPASDMCIAGTVVASWPLVQEVAGSSPLTVMTNIFVTEFAEFSETFRKNSIVPSRRKIVLTYLPSVTHEVLFIGFVSSPNSKVDSNPEWHHHSQCENHIVHDVEALLSSRFELHGYFFLMVDFQW